MTAPSDQKTAIVIGAGAVGLCSALYLQRDGWQVTVIDPEDPGQGASGGNAGLIAVSIVTPVAMPGTLKQVPRMLLDREGSLRIRWRYLPRLMPWLAGFLRASTPARVEAISKAIASMTMTAFEAYRPLLEDAGAEALIRRQGYMVLLSKASQLDTMAPELAIKRRLGVAYEILDAHEVRQMIPALGDGVLKGVFYPEVGHAVDPQELMVKLARCLTERGGRLLKGRATGFDLGPEGVRAVRTTSGERAANIVVVAAGAWSKSLAAALGDKVPLDCERGYHVMIPNPGIETRLPLVSADLRFCMTPMAKGLRLAGTVEFAGLDAPPDFARAELMKRHAKRVFPDLATDGATSWMGRRPSMPDSLPVLGRARRHANAYYAFGHGHIGLTCGAASGKAIADLASGRSPAFDTSPFAADRF